MKQEGDGRTERASAAAIENAIAALPGIRGAKAEMGPTGVESMRVLVIPERTTSQTIADIQDVIASKAGHLMDRNRIQIIRTAAASPMTRRRLASLGVERTEDRFVARVTLELGGDILAGDSTTVQGDPFEKRAIAQAVLNGLRELIDFPVEVQRVYVVPDFEEPFAVVVLARPDDILVGSAAITHDEFDAIARATLDALNRVTWGPKEAVSVSV